MIPAAFEYERASSIEEAIQLLVEHGEDAKLLAGGHSLLPLMKLRLARPAVLVDLGRLPELSYIRDEGSEIAIGALTRHRDLEVSSLLATHAGLIPEVARHIGDPQVRHRGTIGGSIAHGDPAGDLPTAILALDGQLVVRGPNGVRQIAATDAFLGFLETAIAPNEVLLEVRVPKTEGGFGFEKFRRRAMDWAIVGVAAVGGSTPRVGLVNMGSTPLRAYAVEEALAAGSSIAEAAELADVGTEPTSDLGASAEYRRHLAKVLVRRALEEAAR